MAGLVPAIHAVPLQNRVPIFSWRPFVVTEPNGTLYTGVTSNIGRRENCHFGGCFAYACARFAGAPLLYKGDDFPQTDIETA
jgi:hypothetical protein